MWQAPTTKTGKIAMGGICTALAVIFMFGASFVPGIELTLFLISSLFTAVMVLEAGAAGGLSVFAASSLLGLILVPNKLALIPYIFCFGYYAVLKYYIEKIKSGVLQMTIKVVYFAAIVLLGLLVFRSVLTACIHMPDWPVAGLIVAGIVLLVLYDYVLSFLINWYRRRFKGSPDNLKLIH
ncbi:MAG: hypothetical protein ACSW8G_07105 [Bacillota bacterium]